MEPVTQAERIAALLDGRLGERERAELLAELDGSEEQLEILADAAAVTRELEEEDRAAGVISITERRPRRLLDALRAPRVLRAAAAIVAVALGLTLWNVLAHRGSATFTSPVAALPPGTRLPPGLGHTWSETRGSDGQGPGTRMTSFRFGVLTTDLELTASAGDTTRFKAFADSAARLLRLNGDGIPANDYQDLATQVGGPSIATLRKLAGETAAGLDRNTVELGAWTEAARVAVAVRDSAFFRHRESRPYVTNGDVGELTDGGEDALARVRAASREAGGPDWDQLRQALDDLLAEMS